ncbi:EPIDERMAL PATTERNING FACTOR-like protein 3 [Bienertia sinuspersici]
MGKGWFFCIVLLLQALVWVPVTSRPLTTYHDTSQLSGSGGIPESLQASYNSIQESQKISGSEKYKGMNGPGSRPPNCEHKCGSCNPCVAIQVPTISGHLGIQYANYEPISWKCKCGATFYSP